MKIYAINKDENMATGANIAIGLMYWPTVPPTRNIVRKVIMMASVARLVGFPISLVASIAISSMVLVPASWSLKCRCIFSTTMMANVCYDYGTNILVNLCLKKDVSVRVKEGDVCLIDSEKLVQNSAGPVQVTRLMVILTTA